jgi:type I restriction enzyme S subunit
MIYIVPKDWCLKKLGECIVDNPEYGANSPAIDYTEQLPRYLRITDISESGALLNGDKKSIPEEIAKDYLLKKGDMVFARSGATVGKTYLHKDDKLKIAYAGYLIKFNTSIDILLPKYLFYFTKSNFYKIWIQTVLRQGAQPNINAQEYCSLKLPIPPIPEQQKIAEILSTWDEAIEKLERLIELKEKYFKYLLNRSINNKFLKCQKGYIKDIAKVITGKTPNTADETNFGDDYLFVSPSDLGNTKYIDHTERKLSPSGANKVCIVPPGTIFFTGIGIIGKLGIATTEATTNQQIHSLIAKENIDHEYLYYLMLSLASKISLQAGTHVMPILSKTLLEAQPVRFIVNKSEQKKIANLLSTLDYELFIFRNSINSITKQKQGLMQKLLTGRIRVSA